MYVHYDLSKNIDGIFANKQPGYAEVYLQDADLAVVAFKEKFAELQKQQKPVALDQKISDLSSRMDKLESLSQQK